MPYYRIKCPYCMNEINNDEICFKISDAVHDVIFKERADFDPGIERSESAATLKKRRRDTDYDGGIILPDDEFDSSSEADGKPDSDEVLRSIHKITDADERKADGISGALWDNWERLSDKQRSTLCNGWEDLSADRKKRIMDYCMDNPTRLKYIEKFWGNTVKRLTENSPAVPDMFRHMSYSEPLVSGIEIKGFGSSKERYCPYCADAPDAKYRGRKLPRDAGMLPSFVILLMGTSRAGKTTYLTALYHELSEGTRVSDKLEYGGQINIKTDANDLINLPAFSGSMFKDGIIPDTTPSAELIPDPLRLTVTVKYGDNTSEVIIYMRDIAGENLRSTDSYATRQLEYQFKRFDAFMLLFDPETFEHAAEVFSGIDEKYARESNLYWRQLDSVISVVFPHPTDAPTLAMITKSDMFYKNSNAAGLRSCGIKPCNGALVKILSSYKTRYDTINGGVNELLTKLSPGMQSLIKRRFNKTEYALTSAVGRRAVVVGKKVENPKELAPENVAEAMARLLMSMKLIPPYDTMKWDITGRGAYDRDNINIVNEWGTSICCDWKKLENRI